MQNHYVRWGLIASGIAVLIMMVVYFINPKMVFNMSLGLAVLALVVFCMYKAGTDTRQDRGGFITWGQALTPVFLTGLIYVTINALYQFVLMNFIDPSLLEMQQDAAIEIQEKMMQMMGQELTEDQIEMASSQGAGSFFGAVMGILGGALCMIFPISAIMALVIRRENPESDLA